MNKIKIKLVELGGHSKAYNLETITKHKSNLFEITGVETRSQLPSMDGDSWHYTCETLSKFVKNDSTNAFAIGLTEHMLDDNYYIRRLGNDACVISYFQLIEVIKNDGNTVENFILRNIYELVAIFRERNNSLDSADRSFVHDDTRGCLYDLNGSKETIIYSMNSPVICDQCTSRLRSISLPHGFIDTLKKEIQKIRKPLYSRIADWIKQNSWKAFFFVSIWAIFLNLAASLIYEQTSKIFSQSTSNYQSKKVIPQDIANVLQKISKDGVDKVLKLSGDLAYQGDYELNLNGTKELRDLGILIEFTPDELEALNKRSGIKHVYGVKTTELGKKVQSHFLSTLEEFTSDFQRSTR